MSIRPPRVAPTMVPSPTPPPDAFACASGAIIAPTTGIVTTAWSELATPAFTLMPVARTALALVAAAVPVSESRAARVAFFRMAERAVDASELWTADAPSLADLLARVDADATAEATAPPLTVTAACTKEAVAAAPAK